MISSSKLDLVSECPGSLTLPWRDEPTSYSEAGTERHEGDELAINAGDVPEEYESRWPGLTWRAESAYVYDISIDTSQHRGYGIGRKYGTVGPFEVPGTIDAEGRGNGILVVVDRKGHEIQAPAGQHRQVRFLALAAARHRPADRIIVAIRPEIGPLDVAELDPVFDLDVIAHDIKQLVIQSARVRSDARSGKPVEFRTGRHCRWCPAFAACPKQADLKALVQLEDDHPELALSTLVDDDTAADVYELWKRVGILHKRIGQQLYAHAAMRPIPLGNGKLFGKHEKLGNERLDGDVVYEVVKSHHGQEVADAAVTRAATKTKLDAALKGKRGAVKAVLAEVRALGGATRKAGETIGEYEVAAALPAPDDEPKLPESAPSPF